MAPDLSAIKGQWVKSKHQGYADKKIVQYDQKHIIPEHSEIESSEPFISDRDTTEKQHSHTNSRPNILLIFADDLDHGPLGFMGNSIIHTANIDQLAADGVVFRNAFATTATCVTSRGNLMTGRYAAHTAFMRVDRQVGKIMRTPRCGRPIVWRIQSSC